MPKKKTNTIAEGSKDTEQVKSEKILQKSQEGKGIRQDSITNIDKNMKVTEIESRIIRELYKRYGAKDSHTNKHLYHGVMFEVAILSRKSLSEVMNNWPKFDVFTISEKVKETVEKELEENPAIVHKMLTNAKMIADMILAKAVLKIMS